MNSDPTDRRSFLSSSAAAAGLLAIPQATIAKQTSPISLGVQSYTFRNFDLEPALKRMKELGIKHAEFYSKHLPPDASPEKLKGILSLCKEYEVTPVGFGVSSFSKNHDANKKIFDFGKAVGLKYLSASPSADAFDSLDKLCEEYKIAIAIHPHGPAGKGRDKWWSAEIILKAVKDHNKLIGACLDTGHLLRMAQLGEKLDPAEQVKIMGDRNFGMHLKDHDNKRKTDVVTRRSHRAARCRGSVHARRGKVHRSGEHRVRGEPRGPVAGHEEVRGVCPQDREKPGLIRNRG
ncbi:MAG: sugar phosphate isomerase/epimerase [Gemmataceae bacterium]